ncbi:hypothetical protein Pcinc_015027 [Petrolisthes cinctipes]|uniref:Uncharacterized protein n=1 Tax=Petrolisthes cinctipes TaxID=88211 RepID=A0AAE1KSM6_PETCI|nr:hypothetical protein Pcinc_015027 [Petrolisthes cinctipes]
MVPGSRALLCAVAAEDKDITTRVGGGGGGGLVSELLRGGADPNLPDARGTTPLMLAAIRDSPRAALALLQHSYVGMSQ